MPATPTRPPMRPMTGEGLATTITPMTAYQMQGRFGPTPSFTPPPVVDQVDPSAYPGTKGER